MSANTAGKFDATTEEKIVQAARSVFHRKGFVAARTRDIADEAGINLALLNYYFRSKEKLFEVIMLDTVKSFFRSVSQIFNDETTSFERKIEMLSEAYIDQLLQEPGIPLFIMSELRSGNAGKLVSEMNARQMIMKSVFAEQFEEAVKKGRIKQKSFLQFLMNLLGLIVFPFVASDMLKIIGKLSDRQYRELLLERKSLIPVWVKSITEKSA